MNRQNDYPEIDRKRTGERIRALMKQCGFTVENIRAYLQLGSVQSIYHWIEGKTIPSTYNLYSLAVLFGTTIDEVLRGNCDGPAARFVPRQRNRLFAYLRLFSGAAMS